MVHVTTAGVILAWCILVAGSALEGSKGGALVALICFLAVFIQAIANHCDRPDDGSDIAMGLCGLAHGLAVLETFNGSLSAMVFAALVPLLLILRHVFRKRQAQGQSP